METPSPLHCPTCGVVTTSKGDPFKNLAQLAGHSGRCRFIYDHPIPETAGTGKVE